MRRSAGLAASLFLTALSLAGCGSGGVIGSGPTPTPTPIAPHVTNEFPVPTAASRPGGITVGADNFLYFAEQSAAKIGQITTGGSFHEYPLSNGGTAGNEPIDIVTGPDTELWFTEQGAAPGIGQMSLGTWKVKEFPIPGSAPTAIIRSPLANTLAFSDPGHNAIGLILVSGTFVPAGTAIVPSGSITAPPNCVVTAPPSSYCEFTIPSAGANPMGLALNTTNQNIYFAEHDTSKIGQLNVSTGTIGEIPLAANAGPTAIVQGADGAMWFTENGAVKLGRLPISASAATEYALSPATSATALILARDNNLYFIDPAQNKIGQVNVIADATPSVKEFDVTSAGAFPATGYPGSMTLGPDGLIYFPEANSDKIGQFIY